MSLSFGLYILLLINNIHCDSKASLNEAKSIAGYVQKENYDPEKLLSKIFGLQNVTQTRQAGGYGLSSNLRPGQPIHFPNESQEYDATDPNNQQLVNNYQNSQKIPGKRRKKPRYDNQYAGQYGYYNYGFNQQSQTGFQGQNELQTNGLYRPELGAGFGPGNGGVRPSLTESALSSLTEALSSIARNDDHQCVPRLLCEVAAGGRPGQSSEGSIFSALLNMQPLITLLSAYNGISSSPLFTFGRAALLGLTSQGNTASCIYAYPQCPRDADDLINYLNNHNGGFFRFFNGLNQQPNQQGYPQTFNQNNGPLSNFIQNTLGISNLTPGQPQNQDGFPQYNVQLPNSQQNGYPNFNSINHGESYYNQLYQNLGSVNSNSQSNNQNVRFRRDRKRKLIDHNRIEDRIQNFNSNHQGLDDFTFKSGTIEAEEDKSNLRFPEDTNNIFPIDEDVREDGIPNDHLNFDSNSNVRFPDNSLDFRKTPDISVFKRRGPKRIKFPPDSENGFSDYHNTHQSVSQDIDDDVRFESSSEFDDAYQKLKAEFIASFENSNSGFNDGVVYVVRGNGDPNHPEVMRFRS